MAGTLWNESGSNFQVGLTRKTLNLNHTASDTLTGSIRIMPSTKSAKNTFLHLEDDYNQRVCIGKTSKDPCITPDQFSTSFLINKCLNFCGKVKGSVAARSHLVYDIKSSPLWRSIF